MRALFIFWSASMSEAQIDDTVSISEKENGMMRLGRHNKHKDEFRWD